MKVAFFSNFLNHHQTPFCNEMVKLLGENSFFFVSSMPTPQEQLKNGYEDCNNLYPYVVRSYENKVQLDYAHYLYISCDVVIGGNWTDYHLRMKDNKLTFNYSERLFRKSFDFFRDYKSLLYMIYIHNRYRNNNLYLLCAGSFVAKDYSRFFSYPQKKLKWGYFTEVVKYDIESVLIKKRRVVIKFLWVGRMIELKHPEMALAIVRQLKDDGFDVNLTFVGDGPLENVLKRSAEEFNLRDNVEFLGVLPNDEVRKEMLSSNVFLFTSDKQEGWGAVVNEAMNSGCAVVVSNAIGAAGFLIENGVNGLVYDFNDKSDLYRNVKSLMLEVDKIERFARNAYYSMLDVWNPKVAAYRLLEICMEIEGKQKKIVGYFSSGVCSKA